jgi:hypothetical protein
MISPLIRMPSFALSATLTIASLVGLFWSGAFLWPAIGFGFLTLLGIPDMMQERHSVLRNYPILGHIRYLFEIIRPEIRHYMIESDEDEAPFFCARRVRSSISAPKALRTSGRSAPESGSMTAAISG